MVRVWHLVVMVRFQGKTLGNKLISMNAPLHRHRDGNREPNHLKLGVALTLVHSNTPPKLEIETKKTKTKKKDRLQSILTTVRLNWMSQVKGGGQGRAEAKGETWPSSADPLLLGGLTRDQIRAAAHTVLFIGAALAFPQRGRAVLAGVTH